MMIIGLFDFSNKKAVRRTEEIFKPQGKDFSLVEVTTVVHFQLFIHFINQIGFHSYKSYCVKFRKSLHLKYSFGQL